MYASRPLRPPARVLLVCSGKPFSWPRWCCARNGLALVCRMPCCLARPACRYRAGIERVQPADVLAAAQRRLHPRSQTIVVAGDAARLRPELERALGLPVEDLRLERP